MKKIAIFLIPIAALSLFSCSKADLDENNSPQGTSPRIYCSVSDFVSEFPDVEDGKTVITAGGQFFWSEDDCLDFWPSSSNLFSGAPESVLFRISDGAGTPNAAFVGNGWGLKRGARYFASFPHNQSSSYDNVSVSYCGQCQSSNMNTGHIGAYDYLHSSFLVPQGGGDAKIIFNHIGSMAKFKVTVPTEARTSEFTRLTLFYQSEIFSSSAEYCPSDTVVSLLPVSPCSELCLELSDVVPDSNGLLTAYMMMVPTAWAGKTVSVAMTAADGSSYSGTVSPKKDQLAGHSYVYSCTLDKDVTSFSYEYVDLGLSVKWATCNLGASAPEEYGRYYAWGDVVGQTWNGSSWSGGGFSTYPEYELDEYNNLKLEYDAASVNLGGNWRIPTTAEQHELFDNCNSIWTSDFKDTGVAGYILTSNKDGYTNRSIFLPSAGIGINNFLNTAFDYGGYWSSSVGWAWSKSDCAWILYFVQDFISPGAGDNCSRGYSIRPVFSETETVHIASVSLDRSSISIVKNSTCTLTATVEPSNATLKSVSWSSSDANIATVSSDGVVTGKSVGAAFITVDTYDGCHRTAICQVTVTESDTVVSSGSLTWTNIEYVDYE